jgi:FAD dependent oxidoreductase TIGR03364
VERYDLIVVGAGIVGLAHALAAARRNARVLVLERSPRARGASVRNFGMVWPIGQPAGPLLRRALRSRDIWLECAAAGAFHAEPCGALHAATRPDELDVLAEFHDRHRNSGYACRMLDAAESARHSPALRADRVLGALRSDLELCVDPREAIAALPSVLARRSVEFRFESHVRHVSTGRVELSDATTLACERAVVCSGAEMRTLFPATLATAELVPCKLQMLRTVPQPGAWRTRAHLAAGLTLIHYKAFAACASLPRLRERLQRDYPEHIARGVHVLVSQNAAGELTLGDSHEYSPTIDPFNTDHTDALVLNYLDEFFRCPDLRIAQRWHGVYAKSAAGAPEFVARVEPGVFLVTGLGGNGMTLSFGLAEETIDAILADTPWRAPTA